MDPAALVLIFIVAVVASALIASTVWLKQHDDRPLLALHGAPARGAKLPEPSSGERPDLAKRVAFELREITAAERDHFIASWDGIEQRFLRNPSQCLWEAHALAIQIMKSRGYPIPENTAHDIFKDPGLSSIFLANERGEASLGQMRDAILRYRHLVEPLLDVDDLGPASRRRYMERRAS
jgi:hypothetical protein